MVNFQPLHDPVSGDSRSGGSPALVQGGAETATAPGWRGLGQDSWVARRPCNGPGPDRQGEPVAGHRYPRPGSSPSHHRAEKSLLTPAGQAERRGACAADYRGDGTPGPPIWPGPTGFRDHPRAAGLSPAAAARCQQIRASRPGGGRAASAIPRRRWRSSPAARLDPPAKGGIAHRGAADDRASR